MIKNNLIEKVISLAKRRGFVFPSSEIYGGLANSWDYGPLGVELKNKIKALWWQRFVTSREEIVGLDGAIILNQKVLQASGHAGEGFVDLLIECKNCHQRYREDLLEPKVCPNCQSQDFTEPKPFNLLFKTFIGPVENAQSLVYLRPETAQTIFVNFKNILTATNKTLPFGVAQIGKAFRNEITPGNFIFRTREFEQMEIEYFIPEPETEEEWQRYFEFWRQEIHHWIEFLGLSLEKVEDYEVPAEERAHYSKRTIDFLYEFPFGKKELYGLAYRTDFDLRNHEKFSGENLKYREIKTGKTYWPHVIEPSFGVDRSFLAVLCEAYDDSEPGRLVLKLKPYLAPYQVAVFPLLANKAELVKKAREVYQLLKTPQLTSLSVAWDERGNIGKRYYSQDEIGTPFCVTIDFETLENNTVTVRERDTTKQERVSLSQLRPYLEQRLMPPTKS